MLSFNNALRKLLAYIGQESGAQFPGDTQIHLDANGLINNCRQSLFCDKCGIELLVIFNQQQRTSYYLSSFVRVAYKTLLKAERME